MRGKIGKRTVESLSSGAVLWDTELKGFVARKMASGHVSYGLKYTDRKTGRQRWFSLGLHGALTSEQARSKATTERGRIASGTDPQAEREAEKIKRAGIVYISDLLDAHIQMYVLPRKLRSAKQIARAHEKYIKPVIGTVPVHDLKRSHVVRVLDRVASNNGPVMADLVLAYLRKALNWFATRDDDFIVPIVRGMAQTRPRERARDRILSDAELRALWTITATTEAGLYGGIVRVLLLTAQRRQEVAGMRRSELRQTMWTIPVERTKNRRPNIVPLTATVKSVIDGLPVLGGYVFGDTGESPYSGFTKSKARLDKAMKAELARLDPEAEYQPWVIHDLRRTARSLMVRARVPREIAERVLNHVIAGVQGVYDRHDYVVEKQEALWALERLVLQIVCPDPTVVVLDDIRTRTAA